MAEGLLKRLKDFVVKQHCLPWRVANWLNHHAHPLYMLVMYGCLNINTKKHWEKRWAENDYILIKSRIEHVANKIPAGSYVLDVGCGNGSLMEMLRDNYHIKSVGIDFSEAAIKHLENKGLEGRVASALGMPIEAGRFDAVVATELLEHLTPRDCARVVAEMTRVCKKEGRIIVSVPNMKKGMLPQDEPEHLRTFTKGDIRGLLSEHVSNVQVEASENDIHWVAWGEK